MRSLCYVEPGRVEWREVSPPELQGDREAIVAPVAASRCDFDRSIARGHSPYPGPFAIGHEGVVRVVEVGGEVSSVRPGDAAVVVPNISCGSCDRCERGLTAHCRRTPPGATYGIPAGGMWGGLFDDLVRVPFADAMLTAVPDQVEPIEVAAAGDSLGLGHLIMSGHLAAGRRRIAVLSSGAHGLYQAAFAVGLGAESVLYVDDDADRRDLASRLGASAVAGPPSRTEGPFDLIVDASANEAWLRRATRMLEPEGMIECLGGYFGDIRLPGFPMYGGGVNIRFGIGNGGPHVKPTIDAVARGMVRPTTLWAEQVRWEAVPSAYADGSRKIFATRSG
jgi:threonine dehydrogenase-like Zn-dependent dehydrogenase